MRGCVLMNSRGGPPFWGCMLMNSRGGPPILRGGPPLGTISWSNVDIFFSFLISGACFCCDSCYPNWTQTITIWHQNRFIGKVLEVPVCCSRKKLEVWDKNGTNMYNITSKCCPMSCGPAVYFPVISSNYINYDSYSLAVVQSNPSWLGDI